jgi:Uma2 family endonuclease
MTVSAQAYDELVAKLPAHATLILHNVNWEDYEDLLDAVGEASGLRISFCEGILQVMTLSMEHEIYSDFIQNLVRLCTMRLGIRLRSAGSATLRKRKKKKGLEPDACFYVGRSNLPDPTKQMDLEKDPPPDLAVEVDIHHESLSKFPIYAALGIPEVWRFDGEVLIMYFLQNDQYLVTQASLALPVLTSNIVSGFLQRLKKEDENSLLLEFEDWLRSR